MEEQNVNPVGGGAEDISGWSMVPDGDVPEVFKDQAAAQSQEPTEVVQETVPQEVEQTVASTEAPQSKNEQTPVDEGDLESAVIEYLSEKLNMSINSIEDLSQPQQSQALDERVSAIAEFVEKTGRDPKDWFVYQSMNPSEMDDLTAVQVQMSTDYPNLSQEEIQTFISSKYKVDPSLYNEDEVKMSQLQLKIDAEGARNSIENIRSAYAAPEARAQEAAESPIDDNWISSMREELDSLEAIDFDLGNNNMFSFNLDDRYKNDLAERNVRLDEFFDPYVHEDGSWDFDKLNIHRAVIDNMDRIVQSVYNQGISDGKRNLVDVAANVSPSSPNQGGVQPKGNNLSDQLNQALGGGNRLSFNI